MLVSLEMDVRRGLVRSRFSGTLTVEEIRRAYAQITSHPEFRADWDHLGDFREVEEVAITSEELVQAVKSGAFGPGSQVAYVVSKDLTYGLGRLLEVRTEDAGAVRRVFRDMDEARAWLGLPEE